MRRHHMRKMLKHLSLFAILLLTVIMFGCEGDKGDRGLDGTSFGTLTGKVTDTAFPPHNLGGVTVTPTPVVQGVAAASTDASGNYSLTLPNGNYTLVYTKAGYASKTQSATVVATQTNTLPTVALVQTSAAVINVANTNFNNRTTATVTATTLVNDPALVGQTTVITWTDANGNLIATGPTAKLHKPSDTALTSAVAEFAKVRQSVYPPGHDPIADQNDFDVPDFETLDRLQVLPIVPFASEQAAATPFKVFSRIGNAAPFSTFSTVVTGTSPSNTLPFVPNPGIRNVPIGQPVVIQGRLLNSYSWTIAPPTGSNVTTLFDATTRFPRFIPDAPGTYVVTETGSGGTLTIYAGTYVGVLTPAANSDPLGVVDTACSNASCHTTGNASFATPYKGSTATTPVQFFDTTQINNVFNIWTSSGHRHIMVKAMTQFPSNYTLNGCARCHSVGFSQFSSAIKSNGFSDIARATGFTDAAWRANFPNFFVGFDQVLRKSEVQCESCHGPNGDGGAHGQGVLNAIDARMSVSSDMCGKCHGEPLRHGRFQEWRVSGHGDFATAMGEGISSTTGLVNTSCAGCHSGQAFPLWIQQLQGTGGNAMSPSRNLNAANTAALSWLRTNNVQPQTCQTCHQVHNPGTSSGLEGAIVFLRGDYQPGGFFDGTTTLLPSGFSASGVGRGALCITCHNSRNGGAGATATLHEDGDPNFDTLTTYSGPHEACQGDVLMGHNAYYFSSAADVTPGFTKVPQTGKRSAHSFLGDTCVTCHMLKTPTDPNFGYPPGVPGAGTNHTFNIVTNKNVPAADQINALCTQCHGGFVGTGVQDDFDAAYRRLLISAANAVLRIKFGSIAAATAAGVTDLTFIPGRSPNVSVNGAVPVSLASYLSTAPLPVGTANVPAATIPTSGVSAGVQRDLAKANWNISLVAPKYFVTRMTSTSTGYDNGTPILNVSGGEVEVAGDQSKAVHNPSFVFNVMNVTQQRLDTL